MRTLSLALALAALGAALRAAPLAAAPVASFDAYGSTGFTLLSASFVGAPGDATAYLSRSSVHSYEDTYRLVYDADLSVWSDSLYDVEWGYAGSLPEPVNLGLSFRQEARAWGSATRPTGDNDIWPISFWDEYAYPAFFFDPTFCEGFCDAVSSIALTFGYTLSGSVEARVAGGGSTWAEARAASTIGFGIKDPEDDGSSRHLFYDQIRLSAAAASGSAHSDSVSRTRSGTFSLLLRPGQTAYAKLDLEPVRGEARAVRLAAVPLPAGLPLLGAGLGLLWVAGSRRLAGRGRAD